MNEKMRLIETGEISGKVKAETKFDLHKFTGIHEANIQFCGVASAHFSADFFCQSDKRFSTIFHTR